MRVQARIFIWVVVLATFGLCWYGFAHVISDYALLVSKDRLSAPLWFAVIALVSEAAAVDFRIGDQVRQPRSSLAFLPFLGSIVLFGIGISAAIVAAVCAVSQLIFRRRDIERALFNISQGVLAAVAGGQVYALLSADTWGTSVNYAAYFVLAAAFFSVNLGLSSVALSLSGNTPLAEVFARVLGPGGANIWYDLLASPIALVPVVMYDSMGPWGLLLIALPLLLIRFSYAQRQDLIRANDDLLYVLVKAIETRDPYTSGHSLRVATMAKVIAEDLGLPARSVTDVHRAALLHDIGKIDADYAVVIRKPHDLTPEERKLIETHPARGAALLKTLSSVNKRVVDGVEHHHERFDGTGYPDRLEAAGIPLTARIIMICDSVDAMLSDRPYRKALTIEHVRSELSRFAGTQFDPEIVRIMLRRGTLERAAGLVDHYSAHPNAPRLAVAI